MNNAQETGKLVDVMPSTPEQTEIAHLRVKVIDLAKKIDEMDAPALTRIHTYYEPKLRKRERKLQIPMPRYIEDLMRWHKSRKQSKDS
jgi:hypothetical protein